MRKIIFLFILIIPFMIKAEGTCDSTSVKIESIEISEKGNYIEEVNKSTASSNEVNLDLKVNNVGDSIKYKLVLKNTAEDDYEIDKSSLNLSTDYLGYELVTEDNSNIVKAGEEKVVYLVVKYANAVPESSYSNGNFSDTKNVVINLSNQEKDLVKAITDNPYTSTGIILVIVLIVSVLVILSIKKVKVRKYMVLVIPVLLLIPCYAHAICKCEIKVESKVNYVQPFNGIIYSLTRKPSLNGYNILPYDKDVWCVYNDEEDYVSCDGGIINDRFDYYETEEECLSAIDKHIVDDSFYCDKGRINTGFEYTDNKEDINEVYYLKYDIVDNIIKNTYTCFVKDDNEYCLKYGDTYENNKGVLDSYFDHCETYDDTYLCFSFSDRRGYINTDEIFMGEYCGSGCIIDKNGKAWCAMSECSR